MPISLENIEKRMVNASYIKGYSFSPADTEAYKGLSAMPNAKSNPNAFRWAKHVAALTGLMLGATAAAADADEDFDMFGDEEEEEGDYNEAGETPAEVAAAAARRERMEAARKLKEAADAKKKKAKKIEKSIVTLEVKPWEADTDLDALWKLIVATEQEGLSWGETFNKEPVAFGIFKIVMSCVIVDDLVSADDITDKIEQFEDYVQSCNMLSMNKIS